MILVIEGIDASGKATQTKKLVERFKTQGVKSERFDFPRYQTKVGQDILGLLTQEWNVLDASGSGVPEIRALVLQSLMTVNRYEHYSYLKEWSEKPDGVLVLDRYFGSGIVYGECDGLDRDFLLKIHEALPQPDAWVFVDITAEESVKRRPERRDEYETREGFMDKVRNKYLSLFKERSDAGLPWSIVDGIGSEDEVHNRIWEAVSATK
jgi:dTMP kinase